LTELLGRKVTLAYEVTTLQNEPEIFVNRFWSNFYRTMLAHTVRSAITKLLLVAVAVCTFMPRLATAESQLNLVIAVDLSRSVAVRASGRPNEFQKNIDAVAKVLIQVPAGSHVTIIGITDQSFAQPDILLSATVPDDPGYFGERLIADRNELVREWKSRSQKLQPNFPRTDILGALLIASQVFTEELAARRKVLIIFSDMRNTTPELNLDSPEGVTQFSWALMKRRIPVADLRSIGVQVLGVDAASKSINYWSELRDSWAMYFTDAGADLRSYSVLRAVLPLQP